MKTVSNILDCIHDPQLFRPWFDGASWRAWITFLKVLFGLALDEDDTTTYERHTKHTSRPKASFREARVIVGRRGGKSFQKSGTIFVHTTRSWGRRRASRMERSIKPRESATKHPNSGKG